MGTDACHAAMRSASTAMSGEESRLWNMSVSSELCGCTRFVGALCVVARASSEGDFL